MHVSNVRPNHRYEILTPTGFQPFDGIRVQEKEAYTLKFSDGSSMVATGNHLLLTPKGWQDVSSCGIQTIVSEKNGQTITLIDKTGPFIERVYDPVNVANGSCYESETVISHNCSFLSTSYTLISSKVLQTLKASEHVAADESGYFEFEPPDPTRNYVMMVDTGHGTGDDDSAFAIVDITELPYRVAATYANNTVNTMEYPQIVEQYAKRYHHPWLMVEVMDVGRDVAFILFRDFEYPKFMATVTEKRLGQRLVFNSRMNRHLGLRMTAGVKRSGAAVLKTLVEKNKLVVNDYRIIQQLSTFVQRGATYMAETGHHDDLVTPLLMLAWVSLQPNFAEITTARAVDDFIDMVRPQGDEEIPVKIRAEEPDPVGILGDAIDDDDPSWLLR